MKQYRTTQPEAAAKRLCKSHNLVVALQWLLLPRRMALRQSEIKNVQLYHVRRKSDAETHIRAWRRTGGLYIREYSGRPDYGHAEAILRVEAPTSMATLEQEERTASEKFVIAQPARWDMHRNALIDLFPPSEIAQRFWQTLEIYRQRKPRNIDLAMLKMMELPEAGVVCIPKTEFYKKGNLSVHQMNRIAGRNSLLLDRQRAQHYCTPVTLRFEPTDEKPEYRELYRFIAANCPRYLQYHVIRNGEPGTKFPHWKMWLRQMHYLGCLQREDEINFWMPGGMEPDYSVFDAEHQKARAGLEEVIKFVESLPELPLK